MPSLPGHARVSADGSAPSTPKLVSEAPWNRLVSTAPGVGPIVVVSHGGVGTLLLCHLKGVPISRTEEQPGGNGGPLLSLPHAHEHSGPWLEAH